MEKDVTLAITNQIKAILEEQGARVILTRSADTTVTNLDRLKKAVDGDLLVSIHANSVGLTTNPGDIGGTATFYRHLCYRPLSTFILDRMLRTGLTSFGNVGGFNSAMVQPTELPSVLVETAFISQPEEEMKLLDSDFQHEVAERIVDGIRDFLDSCDE
jgi:N-acetylmuramoyl-L-alanine amidase